LLFAAPHLSAFGPKRHFVAAQQMVAFGGIATVGVQRLSADRGTKCWFFFSGI
jgi:hypothetical protein